MVMCKKTKAFTLLELAAVMVILGVLATLGTFNFTDASMRLAAQAQRLKTDLRYIQMRAMAEHAMYRINFSANQYTITESDGTTAIYYPASNINTTVYDTGITASTSSSQLLFNSFGTPYTTTSTPLTSNATVTFTATDGTTATVTIRPETGYASIS